MFSTKTLSLRNVLKFIFIGHNIQKIPGVKFYTVDNLGCILDYCMWAHFNINFCILVFICFLHLHTEFRDQVPLKKIVQCSDFDGLIPGSFETVIPERLPVIFP